MADFSIPVVIPDDKVADFLDALRYSYKAPAATSAELKDMVTQDVRNNLKAKYKEWRAYQLKINPPSDEIDIT